MADIGLAAADAKARVRVSSKACLPNESSSYRGKISGEAVSLVMYVTCSFDVNARWRDGSRARLSRLSRPAVRRVDCGVVPSRAPLAADATTFARSVDTMLICCPMNANRSEEHTSELQSLMRNSYAVLCLKTTHTQYKHRKTTYL